ncbi:MAG: hypothetical protein AAGJ70_14635 [Pseudomonadota bacterium]
MTARELAIIAAAATAFGALTVGAALAFLTHGPSAFLARVAAGIAGCF